jgi:hypothetical protein
VFAIIEATDTNTVTNDARQAYLDRGKGYKAITVYRDSSSGKFILKRAEEKSKGFPSNRSLKQGELPKR